MGDPASGVLWGDRAEGGPDSRAVCFECPWLGGAEEGLDLREGLLDRVEVGRVGREEPELSPAGLDRVAGTVAGVDREIVGDDDLVGLQGGGQPVDDVAVERVVGDGLVEQQPGAEPSQGERREQRPVLPARAGGRPVRPLTPWRPAVPAGHPEVAAGLVDPDKPSRIDPSGLLAPGGALRLVAFPGSDGLFFRVQPKCRVITRLIVA